MKELDSKIMKKILKRAAETLEGDWVLLGGTLPPAMGIDVRTTVDVDLVPVEKSGNAQLLELMTIAEEFGFPPETINAAAALFLKRIAGFEQDLILLVAGPKARVLRPTLSLYLRLKASRLSESDLMDCEAMIRLAKKEKWNDELSDAQKDLLAGKDRENFKTLLNLLGSL